MKKQFIDPRLKPEHINKAALVSVREGRLLVARSFGREKFYLPGGKVDAGESLEEALVREVREELACEVQAGSVRYYSTLSAQAEGKRAGKQVVLHCFTAVLEGEPTASEEIEELAWLGQEQGGELSSASQLVLAELARKSLVTNSPLNRKAVLFDLDDTLFYTRQAKWNQHRQTAKTFFNIDLKDETLQAYWGMPFEPMIELLYEGRGSNRERVEAYESLSQNFPKVPIEGARETVEALLGAGIAVGIVSSAVTEKIREELARHNFPLDALFTVQGADLSRAHKPDPAVFEDAVRLLRACGRTDITYVGDALMDEAAAYGAGFEFYAVTTGLFAPEDFESRTPVLGSITELPQRLGLVG